MNQFEIKIETNIFKVKQYLETLYFGNLNARGTLHYDVLYYCWKDILYLIRTRSRLKFAIVKSEDDKPIIIMPFRSNNNLVTLAGKIERFDYIDTLYDSNLDSTNLTDAFIELLKFLKVKGFTKISWNWMPNFGLSKELIEYSEQQGIIKCSLEKNNSVQIELPDNYNVYFSSLSKHVKQNIRTAYNRLKKDHQSYFNESFMTNTKHKKECSNLFNEYWACYINRHKNRYARSKFKLFANKLFHYTNSVFSSEHGFVSEFRINGEIAAFMLGYVNNNKSILIPKLCINEDYKFYSPGLLLVNETIKYMFDNGYKVLDLGRGTENYKFQMGGKQYRTNNLEIDLI